jgi:tetratricopeptide (TPR) repeat protein
MRFKSLLKKLFRGRGENMKLSRTQKVIGLILATIAVICFIFAIFSEFGKEGETVESHKVSVETSVRSGANGAVAHVSASSVSMKIAPNFFHDKLEKFLWEYELGDRSLDSGKKEEAIEHFEKSVEIFPTIVGYLALGSAYYTAEKFELARGALRDAVVLAKEYDLMDSEAGKAAQDLLDVVEAYLAK